MLRRLEMGSGPSAGSPGPRGMLIQFPGPFACVFTSRDLVDLLTWHNDGGCRVAIEHGTGSPEPDGSAYALLYAGQETWATWGVTRTGNALTVWCCKTGADIGRFATMRQALGALPLGTARPSEAQRLPSAAIIPLRRETHVHA